MANIIKFCTPTMPVTLEAAEGGETAKLKVVINRIGRTEAKDILAKNPSFDAAVVDFFARIVEYPEVPYSDGVTGAVKASDQSSDFSELTDSLLESQVWCKAAFEAYVRVLHGLPELEKEADLGN
jgi:hypothetical protein